MKTTGILIVAATLVILCGCKQVPYSESDPTVPAQGLHMKPEANYKSPVVFTTDVGYYEPVFNY